MHLILIIGLSAIFVIVTCRDQVGRVWRRIANVGSFFHMVWVTDKRRQRPRRLASSYG